VLNPESCGTENPVGNEINYWNGEIGLLNSD
jgi:hypothetical protein